jgi:tetratricopeptide (TPR) repeat protein
MPMKRRACKRSFLLAVSVVIFAAPPAALSAPDGTEILLDPRALLQTSAGRLENSILEMADYYQLASQNDKSIALLETGLVVCADVELPERCRARMLNRLGRTLTRTRRYDEAAESLAEALDLATEVGDDLTRASVLNASGNNLLWQEGFDVDRVGDQLIALHQESLTIYRRLAEDEGHEDEDAVWSGLGESLFQLAFIDESQGRTGQAEERYRECALTAERGSSEVVLAFCLRHLGYLAVAAGEIDEAEAMFTRSLTARQEAGSVAGTGFAINTLAEFLYEQRSDVAGSLALLQQGLTLMESAEENAATAAILLTLATIYDQEDQSDEAELYARQCLAVARAHQVTFVVERAEQILQRSRGEE